MRPKAVIFDLWETLIDWNRDSAARMLREVDELVGNGFAARWDSTNRRYVAPIRTSLAERSMRANGLGPPVISPAERKLSIRLRVASVMPMELSENGLPFGASAMPPAFTTRDASGTSAVTQTRIPAIGESQVFLVVGRRRVVVHPVTGALGQIHLVGERRRIA